MLAYEVDARLRPVLEEALAGVAGVEVRYADATLIDPAELAGEEWVVVANLPYHVGTPLLLRLLREAPSISRFVVMLQREAVERLAAAPGQPRVWPPLGGGAAARQGEGSPSGSPRRSSCPRPKWSRRWR